MDATNIKVVEHENGLVMQGLTPELDSGLPRRTSEVSGRPHAYLLATSDLANLRNVLRGHLQWRFRR